MEEKNRKIAEWLEPKPRQLFDYMPIFDTFSDGKAWVCKRGTFVVMPRDFYADEAANALLLEALPLPTLTRRLEGWYCSYHLGPLQPVCDPDRKAAICEAFIRLKEST